MSRTVQASIMADNQTLLSRYCPVNLEKHVTSKECKADGTVTGCVVDKLGGVKDSRLTAAANKKPSVRLGDVRSRLLFKFWWPLLLLPSCHLLAFCTLRKLLLQQIQTQLQTQTGLPSDLYCHSSCVLSRSSSSQHLL
jgi:hypothetical protein